MNNNSRKTSPQEALQACLKYLKMFKISWLENIICFGSLSLMAIVPFIEIILSRFKLTIPGSNLLITHFLLISAFFAAMLTTKSGEHISITAVQFIKSDKIKKS
ncbi:MAG: TRAP transporter small permease, partial [Treponema sp.]|nr:TRAP transporter small permease [Treponema sp.]